MPQFEILIDMNIDVHKFIKNIDWIKGKYDRQIIEGLVLHTFRYKALVTLNKIININFLRDENKFFLKI